MIRRSLAIAGLLALLVPALAAQPASATPASPPQGEAPRATDTFNVYSPETSREIFTACDRNGDDRISWLEALEAIVGLDRERFRVFDENNDGRLQFSEFDHQFELWTRRGGRIALKPSAAHRMVRRVSPLATSKPELMRFLVNLDRNGNDRLDLAEWRLVEDILGKDKRIAFLTLDKDLSGDLTLEEIVPIESLVSRFLAGDPRSGQPRLRPLPSAVSTADLNDDSLINADELARALDRIHPSLLQYRDRILASVDADGDRHINRFEALAAQQRGVKAFEKPDRTPGRD